MYSLAEEHSLASSSLLAILPTLAKEWRLALQIRPTSYLDTWASVLQLTTGGKVGQHGDRTPAIFFRKNERVLISSSCGGVPNYQPLTKEKAALPPLREWSEIEVGQREEDGEFTFYISLYGEQVHYTRNSQPREFTNVKIYASNPWHPAQPGSIRNLIVETKVEGERADP